MAKDRRRSDGLAAKMHDQLDKKLVEDALWFTCGNISEASRILSLHRNTLKKIKGEMGLDTDRMSDPTLRSKYVYKTKPAGAPWV